MGEAHGPRKGEALPNIRLHLHRVAAVHGLDLLAGGGQKMLRGGEEGQGVRAGSWLKVEAVLRHTSRVHGEPQSHNSQAVTFRPQACTARGERALT